MKKILSATVIISAILFTSCETASTTKEAEQDSIEAAAEAVIHDTVSEVDTALSSIGDSLKADIGEAAGKIKQHTKELGEAAKQKANQGVEKMKEGAQKVKEAARAGVDAAKEELKK